MKKVHNQSQRGQLCLTQYENGDGVLYNADGDSLYLDATELADAGWLAIAAHVTAGRLKQARS